MAMPPETPIPWIVKDMGAWGVAVRGWRGRTDGGSNRGARFTRRAPSSFALPELFHDQLHDRLHRLLLVRAAGLDGHLRALGRGQHHHAHDAFRIDAAAVARQPYLALET